MEPLRVGAGKRVFHAVALFVQHLEERVGGFPLHHRGIMDERALHFFPHASFEPLLKRTSWELVESTVSSLPLMLLFPFLKWRPFRPLVALCRGLTLLMKGLFGYQCIYFCKNPNECELL